MARPPGARRTRQVAPYNTAVARHSNVGFGLLGHALSRAAGGSYEDVLRKRILERLELGSTTFTPRGDLAGWATKPHDPQGNVIRAWTTTDAIAGASGLWSSAEDMLTYLAANVGPAETPLERAMRDSHRKREEQNAQQDVGLAWSIRRVGDRTIVGHTGGTGGSRAFIGFDPDRQVGLVLLANSRGDDSPLIQLAFDLLAPPPAETRVAEAALKTYVGEYEFAPGRTIVVTLEEGQLFGQPGGQAKTRLFAESDSSFFVGRAGGPTKVRFTKDASGSVAAMILIRSSGESTGRKIR